MAAIDEGLLVLGESVRDSLYYHIGRSHVRREEIPSKIGSFHDALEDLLGAGAKVVERLVAERLCDRLRLDFVVHDDWTLVDYVDHAKRASKED